MKRTNFLISLLLIGGLVFLSSVAFGLGIEVYVPPNWQPGTPEEGEIGFFELKDQSGNSIAFFSLTKEEFISTEEAQAYFNFLKEEAQGWENATMIEKIELTVAGWPAVRHDLLIVQEEERYREQIYFLKLEQEVYSLDFFTFEDLFVDLEKEFSKVVQGITVEQAAPDLAEVTPTATPTSAGDTLAPPTSAAEGEKEKLSVQVPPEWISQNPTEEGVIGYYLLPNEQGVPVAEFFFIREKLTHPLTLSEYLKISEDNARQSFQSLTPLQTQEATIATKPALQYDFLFTPYGNPNQLRGRTYFVILGNQAYSLLFDCLSEDFQSLEVKFQQIIQTTTVQTQAGTASSAPAPATGSLPSLEGGLPLVEEDTSSNFIDPQGKFTIPLPPNTVLNQSLENGAVYQTPNQGELVILNLGSEQAVGGMVAQIAQGKTFHGESTIQAQGGWGKTALYSSTNPENQLKYATLVTTYPGSSLLLIVVLPADQYPAAQEWLLPLFAGVSLS